MRNKVNRYWRHCDKHIAEEALAKVGARELFAQDSQMYMLIGGDFYADALLDKRRQVGALKLIVSSQCSNGSLWVMP